VTGRGGPFLARQAAGFRFTATEHHGEAANCENPLLRDLRANRVAGANIADAVFSGRVTRDNVL
jgi:hypothetical protein